MRLPLIKRSMKITFSTATSFFQEYKYNITIYPFSCDPRGLSTDPHPPLPVYVVFETPNMKFS